MSERMRLVSASQRHFHLDTEISLLNSRYKNSLKNSILNSKNLDLLQKKVKILKAEEQKFESSLCRSQKLERRKINIKIENGRQKSLVQNFKKLKEKEMKEKKNKVKDLRYEEYNRAENRIKHRKINSDNIALEKNKMKKKILEDLSKEKDKINEENQKKINFIKKMDDDIIKRKMENEKHKKIIEIKQLEQEIKILEQFNKKLLDNIDKYKKIGLRKIERLFTYQ
jgi:DNA anti-recombination protein RmuC